MQISFSAKPISDGKLELGRGGVGGFLNPFLPWQKFAQDVGETGKKFLEKDWCYVPDKCFI